MNDQHLVVHFQWFTRGLGREDECASYRNVHRGPLLAGTRSWTHWGGRWGAICACLKTVKLGRRISSLTIPWRFQGEGLFVL